MPSRIVISLVTEGSLETIAMVREAASPAPAMPWKAGDGVNVG